MTLTDMKVIVFPLQSVLRFYFLLIALGISVQFVFSQNTELNGLVRDEITKEPIEEAAVIIVGTQIGALTDVNGKFNLKFEKPLPITIRILYMGYDTLEQEITSTDKVLRFELKEHIVSGMEVEIVDYRISQKEKESPVTIERLDLMAIKETPAANFYDGLGNLKGVDVTAASLGFKIINTRGFNSTQPVRSIQLIDGIDNQAPGLNFALGNLVGSSELDVQSVDIVVGASTALYGPGAFNGVIAMTTKSPFLHKGLNCQIKVGERSLFDGAIRYAQSFKNKNNRDIFAFKISAAYMKAYDWEATNLLPTEQSLQQSQTGAQNAGGYDAINRYGDEKIDSRINNYEEPRGKRLYTGLGTFFRTGYNEKDIADYNTNSKKISTSLHFKPTEKLEIIGGYRFGSGTSVFQGINRISLKDLIFQQFNVEAKHDNFFVRAYATFEDAGNSYDIVRTAAILQRSQKEDIAWGDDYFLYWNSNILPVIKNMEGFKNLPKFGSVPAEEYNKKLDEFINSISDSLPKWHNQTRSFADGKTDKGEALLKAGTPEFNKKFKEITSNAASKSGGTRFTDFSKLYHIQGEYKKQFDRLEIRMGGNFRLYAPNSEGTIFVDTLFDARDSTKGYKTFTVHEFGFFGLLNLNPFKVKKDLLKLTFSLRADKHQNYKKPIFSPSLSSVWTIKQKHFIRASYNFAFRFPTLQDQYLNYNVDNIILRGNLNGSNNVVTIQNLYDFFATSDVNLLKPISVPGVKPERVQTIEIGYKGMIGKRFFMDVGYYYSWYQDFIGYQFVSSSPFVDGKPQPFQILRLSTNAPGLVNTQGVSFGGNFFVGKYYTINGNYSWNRLTGNLPTRQARDPYAPFVPAYNTPEHKFNIGVTGSNMEIKIKDKKIRHLGFSFNYRWVDGFYFEGSPQYTGFIKSYGVLDGQINFGIPRIKTTFKLGATNLLDQKYIQVYGGPYIGRLAYLSINFDWINFEKF